MSGQHPRRACVPPALRRSVFDVGCWTFVFHGDGSTEDERPTPNIEHRTGKGVLACIAAGSNLGDRHGNIDAAVAMLRLAPSVEVLAVSSLIDNPAVGGPADAPAFLNGAVLLRTTLPPELLLDRLLAIEAVLGRTRQQKWEPRLIDLDLLLFGHLVLHTADLTVPHPLMHTRRFVLEPLVEIAPEMVHPRLQQTVRALLDALPAR